MVTMRSINGVVLASGNVCRIWLAVVVVGGLVVGRAVLVNEVLDEGVRAGGVVGRVAELDDGLVRRDGETLDIADLVDVLAGKLSAFQGVFAYLYSGLTMMRRFSGSFPLV